MSDSQTSYTEKIFVKINADSSNVKYPNYGIAFPGFSNVFRDTGTIPKFLGQSRKIWDSCHVCISVLLQLSLHGTSTTFSVHHNYQHTWSHYSHWLICFKRDQRYGLMCPIISLIPRPSAQANFMCDLWPSWLRQVQRSHINIACREEPGDEAIP